MFTETAFATPAAQSTLSLTNLCPLGRLRTTVLTWSYTIDSEVWMARKANKMHPQTEKSVRNVQLSPRGERWQKFISQPIEPAFSKYRIRHVEPDILSGSCSRRKTCFGYPYPVENFYPAGCPSGKADIHPANRIVITSVAHMVLELLKDSWRWILVIKPFGKIYFTRDDVFSEKESRTKVFHHCHSLSTIHAQYVVDNCHAKVSKGVSSNQDCQCGFFETRFWNSCFFRTTLAFLDVKKS